MQAKLSKRLLAFIIDLIIVFSLSSLLTSFIPVNQKVSGYYEKLEDLVNNVTEKQVKLNNYIDEVNSITYEINRESVLEGILDIVIYLLYFIVLPMYNNGQTFGKKLLRIRVTSNSAKQIDSNSLLLRALLLYNIWAKILLIILIVFINKQMYIKISNYAEYVQLILMATIVLTILLRKDRRGLHDLVAKTKVIEEWLYERIIRTRIN